MKSAQNFKRLQQISALLLSLVTVSMTGCHWNSLVPETSMNESIHAGGMPETTGTADTEPEAPPIVYYHPLTGLACEEKESTSRPISICIGNGKEDMPHYGLSLADILIEAPVEEETRFTMLFNREKDLPRVGSIRSTRKWLVDMQNAFGSVAVFNGTTDTKGEANQIYPGLDAIDYAQNADENIFYPDTSRPHPYNLMSSGSLLYGALQKSTWNQKATGILPFQFAKDGKKVQLSGKTALSIHAQINANCSSDFTYNPLKQEYLRNQNGSPHTDSLNGKQLSFTNLFFLFCNYSTYSSSSRTSYALDMESGGRGFYMTDGKSVEIRWQMKDGQITFTDAGGETLTVSCGKSYIALMRVSDMGQLYFE